MSNIKPFRIRDIEINPPLVLSPMAGVTDISFRRLLKARGGIVLTVSEFISVEGLTRNTPKSKRQMRFYENERPFAVQIFGGQPERMRMAAEMAEEVGDDILDVNCGCPAPKVVKHGGGSGLLKDYPRLETILTEIKKAITIPLTVKIRAGFYDHTINAVETAKLAESCGAEHIALHGRTRAGLSRIGELGSGEANQGSGGARFRQRRHHHDPAGVRSFSGNRMRWRPDRSGSDGESVDFSAD
jgi:tRNA-dihydrouridine synthase